MLKRAMCGLPKEGKVVIKVKVLEPKPLMVLGVLRNWRIFFGTWSSTSRLQRRLIKMVIINSMYLSRDAKLWWRTHVEDDTNVGREKINSWEVLKKELKDQFLLTNPAWVARDSLKKLKHTGIVREYVKTFSSLILDIKNMSKEDKLFNFMSSLQPWAQLELKR